MLVQKTMLRLLACVGPGLPSQLDKLNAYDLDQLGRPNMHEAVGPMRHVLTGLSVKMLLNDHAE